MIHEPSNLSRQTRIDPRALKKVRAGSCAASEWYHLLHVRDGLIDELEDELEQEIDVVVDGLSQPGHQLLFPPPNSCWCLAELAGDFRCRETRKH